MEAKKGTAEMGGEQRWGRGGQPTYGTTSDTWAASVSRDVGHGTGVVPESIPAEPGAHPLVVGLWGRLRALGLEHRGGSGGCSRSFRLKLFTHRMKYFNNLTAGHVIPVVPAETLLWVGARLHFGSAFFPAKASVECAT